jgi:hypothetical protein
MNPTYPGTHHYAYPLNAEVLLIPHLSAPQKINAVVLDTCDERNINAAFDAVVGFWQHVPADYLQTIDKESSLYKAVENFTMAVNLDRAVINDDQKRRLLVELNRLWYEHDVIKPHLTAEGFQRGIVAETVNSSALQQTIHQTYPTSPDDLAQLLRDLRTTYEVSVVSPTVLTVTTSGGTSYTKSISSVPIDITDPRTEDFWDVHSIVAIMSMFATKYKYNHELSAPYLRNILAPLEILLSQNNIQYNAISKDISSEAHYYYVLTTTLFSLFLYAWQTPCANAGNCKIPQVPASKRGGRLASGRIGR